MEREVKNRFREGGKMLNPLRKLWQEKIMFMKAMKISEGSLRKTLSGT